MRAHIGTVVLLHLLGGESGRLGGIGDLALNESLADGLCSLKTVVSMNSRPIKGYSQERMSELQRLTFHSRRRKSPRDLDRRPCPGERSRILAGTGR